ncbi:MAG TPA: SpoIIE family protein phosphatase [Tissierellia bacterium]|nr:SpoIIE family protein phosphatase [Tissierellia bacterium]
MLKRDKMKATYDKLPEYSILNYHVLESMADWVRMVDYDGTVLYANEAMKRALGADLIGKKCYETTGKNDRCNFCISKRSIINNEVVQKEEIINGRYYSVISSPVKDMDGNIIGAVEVLRDVTRERKLELKLIEKNTMMINDIKFAEKIQRKILPKKGLYKNVKIDHIYKPSEMLSGDIFDVFYIDDNKIGVYICDVAGHGITASMMTMFVRQTMRSIKDYIKSPSVALTELHKSFSTLDLGTDRYFTIFYGVFDTSNNRFIYANAGHNCIPIKYNSKGVELLKIKGFPISLIFNEIYYEENEIILSENDKLLFYTDGISEVRDANGTEFGVNRIIEIIKEDNENVLDNIIDSVERFRWGEQRDDYAMLLMEILGNRES